MKNIPHETTYTQARANFAKLLDRVCRDRETVYITRRGEEKAALISADELAGLMETAHLLRSPANARRLLQALKRAMEGSGRVSDTAALKKEIGLGK
jgi:antitoxin YefM